MAYGGVLEALSPSIVVNAVAMPALPNADIARASKSSTPPFG
jgi:hypothetical protein